ncbi:MAG TPA: DHA2 family efflux MFS transporter permease subunit [Actinocrinis sp.]|jgi:EmrB/QacA subfamily drug resistance transporter|uniref:DHA2 family efflux MFS transporter permease subunit n=1 Tax=Actinocrinis sp. TaxID=1920516 RepID=UPI002DDD7801|nr:DHA2 family efflux MFS transporter permease subunit [Actinocrinis sp.]HEV3171160.1 DHA2 family efflux MFS transporter permease subunit [Actinocrinis sp.]
MPESDVGASGPAERGAAPARQATPWRVAVVACSLPMAMVTLSNLVVSTALRTLALKLHASTAQLQWFINAYVLAFACLLLAGAALGDRFGRRRVFIQGIVLFTVASVGCGLSTTSAELIATRAVQGVGAAAVLPLSLSLLAQTVPAKQRALALGLWSSLNGVAVALGPVVGGAVLGGLDWHWIFWLNIPVGVVSIPLVLALLPESKLPEVGFDVPGMVLAAAGLVAVVWGIVHAQADGWLSAGVLGAFAAGVALLTVFTLWQRRAARPLLPLSFYRIRAFTLTNIVSAAMYFGVFGSLFLIVQFLQIAPPRTPLQAGVMLLPWTLMPMVVAPLAGALTDRLGGGRLMALGLFLQAGGLAWLILIATANTSYGLEAGPMLVSGIGMGFVFAPTAAVVIGSVGPRFAGKASGANTTVREIGGALGIAVLSTVFVDYGGSAGAGAAQFLGGLRPAIWVGVAVVMAGGLCALAIPRATAPLPAPAAEEPVAVSV